MSHDVGHRRGLDLALLWLWYRLVATAPIRPLAWEPPYATGTALEKTERQIIIMIIIIKIVIFWNKENVSLYMCTIKIAFTL